MAEIAPASLAMVLGHSQMQGQHLITLPGMLHRPEIGRLNPQPVVVTVLASRPTTGFCPDGSTPLTGDGTHQQSMLIHLNRASVMRSGRIIMCGKYR